MISNASASVFCWPKVIVPRHTTGTCRSLLPRFFSSKLLVLPILVVLLVALLLCGCVVAAGGYCCLWPRAAERDGWIVKKMMLIK